MIKDMEILLENKLSMISRDQIKKDLISDINIALEKGETIEGLHARVEK